MENEEYLKKQLITYLGNKRKLLVPILNVVNEIGTKLGKEKMVICDLFAGSGIVSRALKQRSSKIISNDFERYSYIINKCYLKNSSEVDWAKYDKYLSEINKMLEHPVCGIITNNYSPADEDNITPTDRVFYTRRNAMYIDTVMRAVEAVVDDEDYKPLFYGPLLSEASIHTNTSGVFKGFYKSKTTGCGKFGGESGGCLDRIKGDITLNRPILSNFECDSEVYCMDANLLVGRLERCDIVYMDPPYNSHPYGSNYFMLNTIVTGRLGENLSKVSGIPSDWQKSQYNKRETAIASFDDLIGKTNSEYIVISFNNEGFISKDEMVALLSKYGSVEIRECDYTVFRGGRNIKKRKSAKTIEYLYILHKK